MQKQLSEIVASYVRTVPDWPKPGVMFKDITPVLSDPRAFRVMIDIFVHRYMDTGIDLVAGVDARGFIIGSVVAYELNRGFVPIRKKGKLPFGGDLLTEEYSLEYGTAAIELNASAAIRGASVLLIDDLIATGGTLLASINLLERAGASLVQTAAVIDLPALGGSKAITAATHLEPFSILSF